MAYCSSCKAPILWTVTTGGKRLPVDAQDNDGITEALEHDDGNVIPTGDTATMGGRRTTIPIVYIIGHVLEAELFPDEPPAHRWRPHFATCPTVAQHRPAGP